MGQIQHTVSKTHPCLFISILSMGAFVLQQSWIVVTKSLWPVKLNIFTKCPFTEKVCLSLKQSCRKSFKIFTVTLWKIKNPIFRKNTVHSQLTEWTKVRYNFTDKMFLLSVIHTSNYTMNFSISYYFPEDSLEL